MREQVIKFAEENPSWEIIVYFGGEGIVNKDKTFEINFSMRYLTTEQLKKVSWKNINEIIFFHELYGEKRFKMNL